MTEATMEQLERQRARWWATVSSGDLDGYLALFDEDAVWVTPELDEIVGREAIRAWLAPVFSQFDYELTITVADVRVAGSLGIERARFVSRMTPKPPSTRPLPGTPPASEEPEPEAANGSPGDEATAPVAPAADAEEVEPLVGDEAAAPAGPELAVDATGEEGHEVEVDEPGERAETEAQAEERPAVDDDGPPPAEATDSDDDEPEVEAPLVPVGPDAADDEPHEGRYLMYWRWHADAGWLVHRYADVTGVG